MSLTTFSLFFYDLQIDRTNRDLDFKEGSNTFHVELNVGKYSPQELMIAIKDAMNSEGANSYAVTLDRYSKRVSISANATFELLVSSGAHFSTSIFTTLGFTGSDRTGVSSYAGNLTSTFKSYAPQFILQDHISTEDKQRPVDATIRKTSTGKLEVVTFGTEKFLQCNIKYANNFSQDGNIIKTNTNGIDDLRDFMQYIVTKGPLEFMANINDRNVFQTFVLETTPQSKDGLEYELKELYDKGLPNYFETGKLLFREVE